MQQTRGGHGCGTTGVNSGKILRFFGPGCRVFIFSAAAGVCVAFINVTGKVQALLNFGCIDSCPILNRSWILKFEKIRIRIRIQKCCYRSESENVDSGHLWCKPTFWTSHRLKRTSQKLVLQQHMIIWTKHERLRFDTKSWEQARPAATHDHLDETWAITFWHKKLRTSTVHMKFAIRLIMQQ